MSRAEKIFFGVCATALIAICTWIAIDNLRHPQMPTTVDVNGISWRIQEVDHIGNQDSVVVGMTACALRRIYLTRSAVDKQRNLMHELTHAMVCEGPANAFGVNNLYFNSKTNEEHEGIYNFTDMWAELLTRNPDVARYMGQEIK